MPLPPNHTSTWSWPCWTQLGTHALKWDWNHNMGATQRRTLASLSTSSSCIYFVLWGTRVRTHNGKTQEHVYLHRNTLASQSTLKLYLYIIHTYIHTYIHTGLFKTHCHKCSSVITHSLSPPMMIGLHNYNCPLTTLQLLQSMQAHAVIALW